METSKKEKRLEAKKKKAIALLNLIETKEVQQMVILEMPETERALCQFDDTDASSDTRKNSYFAGESQTVQEAAQSSKDRTSETADDKYARVKNALRALQISVEDSETVRQSSKQVQRKDLLEMPKAKKARCELDGTDASNETRKDSHFAGVFQTVQEGLQSDQAGSEFETVDDEYARARKVQRALQKSAEEEQQASKFSPRLYLSLENLLPFNKQTDTSVGKWEDRLPPLFMVDLQHLMLLALLKDFNFWTTRWCCIKRPRKLSSVVIVVLKDVSISDYEEHPDSFPFLKNSFLSCVEIVSPAQYNSTVEKDVCTVPLFISQLKCYTKREDVHRKILKLISKPTDSNASETEFQQDFQTLQEVGQKESCVEKAKPKEPGFEDNFPRTSLLLSTSELMEQRYPMPVDSKNKLYGDFAFTKDCYSPATESSPLFAVDCEMCHTTENQFELTRVSIVNEQKEVVYDELVKPYNKITNYLTKYSGMTEELLSPVTKRIEDVHRDLRNLLPSDAILCGQSLWNDLNALKMFHPYVIDTSIIFNQSGDKNIKCGLRKLAFNFLGQTIQDSKKGHCSIEDAKATMDLVKLKLSKDIEFGDAMLGGVYFPNIRTYFENPSKAQNVGETFSAHPSSVLAPSDTNADSFASRSSQSSSKDTDSSSGLCVQRISSGSVTDRTNGVIPDVSSKRKELEGVNHRTDGDTHMSEVGMDSVNEGNDIGQVPRQQCQEHVGQREAFFQQEGSTVMMSLFDLLADRKKSAGLVGNKDTISRFQSHTQLERVEVRDDSEACSKAVKMGSDKDFTWVELSAFANSLAADFHCSNNDADKRKNLFTQLDDLVQEMVTKLKTRTLVAVVITGRHSERQPLNAATFLKLT